MVLEGQGQEYAIDYMNSQELTEKIRKLEGLTDDERSAMLELVNTQKRYGLVWEDKPEDVEEKLRDNLPVLTEVKERAIINDNPDAPNHILIEGDNLEALTVLAYTHAGKIDVIYIDPPYNTGNKDFVYNDTFIDSENAYRHSTWLSFMSKRLRIAKKLLSDRGVIFISIDDNEQANLKLLCDEIFKNTFVDIFSWQKTETPANLSLKTKKAIEYILCYTKQRTPIKFRGLTKSSVSNNGLMNQTNAEHQLIFPANVVDTKLADGIYRAGNYGTSSYNIELLKDTEVANGFFIKPVVLYGKFKWGQSYLDSEIKKGTQVSIKSKAFSPSYEKKEYEPEVPWNLINRNFGVDTNEIASTQLKEIIGANMFDFPKPVSLIKYLVNFIEAETVLDFFAGSGTTMHAVMQLNAVDGGHRQCILVTNNENGICENVTYERNKRVINGYTKPNGQAVEGLHNNNLRYYKIEHTPRDASHSGKRKIFMALVDLLCFKEGIYRECDSFGSLSLAGKKQLLRYFSDKAGEMLLIYDSRVIPFVVKEIEKNPPAERPIKVYIFADGAYPYNEDFKQVGNSVELIAMPFAINQVLNRILPEKKDELLENELSEEEKEQMMAEAIAVEENEKAQEGLI